MTRIDSEAMGPARPTGAEAPIDPHRAGRRAAPGLTIPVAGALAACGVVAGMLIAYPSDSPAPDIPSVPPTSIAPVSTSTPEEAIDWTVRHFADYLAGADLRKEWVCPADIDRFDPKAPFFSLPRFDEATKTPVTMSAQAVEIRGNQARATVKTIQWVEVDYQYSQGNIHLETGYFSRESGNSWQLCPSAEEAFR